MKINSLLESITPASDPANATSPAPVFGRSDKFLEDDTVEESSAGTSTAGGIASKSNSVGGMQTRGKGSMLQGIKTSKKYPNSASVKEGQLNEIDPRNFDSDEDYYDAVSNQGRQKFSGDWDVWDEIASLENQLRYEKSDVGRYQLHKQIDQLKREYGIDDEEGVAEGSLNEFAPAGGGGNIPRGPKTPRRGPWDDNGEDPYQLRRYNRSIDFFDQFDSDGVDKQNYDKATGEYEGYYFDRDAASGITQIAYFKFDDPTKIGDNDPGVGWYYEPIDESVTGEQINEFAPSDDNGDNEPDEYEILHRLAAMWWLGTEQQMVKAQRTLASMGWEIGEDEGYDDGGVFVVRANDEHGKSYISWPHEDLQLNEQGVAEGLTYAQKHSSWSVQSPKKNEFNTRYKLDQEKEARTHAERIGGKLVKVDQHGHAIRAKKGVAEGSEAQDNLVSILNSFDYYSDNGKVYVNDAGDKIVRQGSNWKHQSGKVGHGSEELGNFLSSKKGVAEGIGNFAKAIDNLHGWYQIKSNKPELEIYEFDDREGGFYAEGTVYHNTKTGRVKIEFEDKMGEYGGMNVDETFNSIGDAMNVLRQITTQVRPKSSKAQNFDILGGRSVAGPDDVYKTDRAGKKGTLSKVRMDTMKMTSPYRRTGPKGVLPEAEISEDLLAQELYKDLQIFKKGADKDIGNKAKAKDISNKPKDKEIIKKVTKESTEQDMKASEILSEGKPGLWANIHAKRERIKHGSGEKMRKPGSKGAPSAQDFKDAAKTSKTDEAANPAQQAAIAIAMKEKGQKPKNEGQDPSEYDMEGDFVKNQIHTIIRVMTHLEKEIGDGDNLPEWVQMKISQAQGMLVGVMDYMISEKERNNEIETGEEGLHEMFDMIESMVESWAVKHGVDSDVIWEDIMEASDEELLALSEDWQKVNKKDKTPGMSRKAVKAYRRENPGSKLQTAVTTKPSKLKKGSKASKRRKSFCARMKGMKKAHASAKTKRNPDSPINKALRRWNC